MCMVEVTAVRLQRAVTGAQSSRQRNQREYSNHRGNANDFNGSVVTTASTISKCLPFLPQMRDSFGEALCSIA